MVVKYINVCMMFILRDLNVFCDDNMLLAGVSELNLVKVFLMGY